MREEATSPSVHVPVLAEEVMQALAPKPGGVYIDGTLGGAGHAAELLRRAGAGTRLLGIDRDEEALLRAKRRLEPFGDAVTALHGTHGDMARLAKENGFESVDGILLDLGVSSDQLDTPQRGFSFRADGPLDMRMDTSTGESAAQLVARLDKSELAKLLRDLGEENAAGRIAAAICREREKASIDTTARLAEIVAKAVGGRKSGKDPATRTFQALRMAVNDEMGQLERALDAAFGLLAPKGRLAVITFESLTDRIVKQTFVRHVGRMVSLPQGGEKWEGQLPKAKWILKRPAVAGETELCANPRARSAKLRVVELSEDRGV